MPIGNILHTLTHTHARIGALTHANTHTHTTDTTRRLATDTAAQRAHTHTRTSRHTRQQHENNGNAGWLFFFLFFSLLPYDF